MAADSPAAAIFGEWRDRVTQAVGALPGPAGATRPGLAEVLGLLAAPDCRFGVDPIGGRDAVLVNGLSAAVVALAATFGDDMDTWRHGHPDRHHIQLRHPLSRLLRPDLASLLDPATKPRGGTGNTVNQTGNGGNQTSGASFRLVTDAANWDLAVGTNNPGQSGDYRSPHYSDLYELWGAGKYFPVLYSRAKVESVMESKTILR
jgi:penicillin amidase